VLGFGVEMGSGLGRTVFGERYAVAPMLDVTDRHFRTMCRMISRHATLYTEMAVDNALIRNEEFAKRALQALEVVNEDEYGVGPVVLQLGGSEPELMRQAAEVVACHGGARLFSAVNLNCGCPSDRVAGRGCFGASLMRTPERVAKVCCSIREGLNDPGIPVTVKCRIGVDDDDSFESLTRFVDTVHRYGDVNHFVIHARKAILGGLNPKQNRSVPPLKYEYVDRLMETFPNIFFSLNGGIKSIDEAEGHLRRGVHGVMLGRAVMDTPWHALAEVDSRLYSNQPRALPLWSRREILHRYGEYADRQQSEEGQSQYALAKPILNFFHGAPRNRAFKQEMMRMLLTGCPVSTCIQTAVQVLHDDVLDLLPGEAPSTNVTSQLRSGAQHSLEEIPTTTIRSAV